MVSTELFAYFEQARSEGRLGPTSIEQQVAHAETFVEILRGYPDLLRILDLGTGAGIPGLVVADELPDRAVTLLDARVTRTNALITAIQALRMSGAVVVLATRAEQAGRASEHRGKFDAVVARSFAKPAVTAECAAPFLRQGGLLIVAEPPDRGRSAQRWPSDGCAQLGLEVVGVEHLPHHLAILRQFELCDARFPRRTGIPEKRPLF